MDAGKTFLRKTDARGISVYSHLTEVLATLLETQPANALDCFEGVSLSKKAAHYQASTVLPPAEAPPELPDPAVPAAPNEAWATSTQAMLKAAAKPSEDEASGQVANMLYERTLFECAGVGLSSDETYRVYVGLVSLQKSKDLASVRFFGKVLGVPTDYYIAEAVYNTQPEPEEGYEPPPPPPGAPIEEQGSGCNTYTYFAATDPAGTWTALPDVTPQQIVHSKRIRKYVTGDLEADVRAYPPFPGQENAYLRALVARIVASTTLCPVGKFTLGEEGGEAPTEVEVGEEGRKPPPASELGELSGWCTRYMGILDIGRCTNLPVEEEEAEEDSEKPKPSAPQTEIPYLAPILEQDWTTATYTHGGPTVAVARSLRWQGAVCAYQLAKGGAYGTEALASVYVGYGQERLDAPFVMETPPAFQSEPDEVHEQGDMPLAEENELFLVKAKEEVAAEAAELPDPVEE